MKTKFYAVKAGRNPGIYLSWDEAKAQVNGFAGAEYKSFTSKSEALDFINGDKSFNYPLQSANFSDKGEIRMDISN
jgi:ribonuclease HI